MLPVETTSFPTLATAWRRSLPWYPGDWIWPAILLLGLAALGGAIAYFATDDEQTTSVVIATVQRGSAAPSTAPVTSTTPTTPATTAVTTTQATTSTTPVAGSGSTALTTWPTGKSGYTTVLQSLPTTRGRHAAAAYARRVLSKGLADVGYLDSAGFSSLHPGYYVVFSGIYSSMGAARNNTATAAAKGFPGAYPRQITP
jgi:hypothetical protein